MTPVQTALIERVRTILADQPTLEEVSMFGVRAVKVDGAMVVSAQKDGGLLVHVEPGRHAELLARPGAAQAEMGRGRTMGVGWISVDADAIEDDDALAEWIGLALSRPR